MVVEEDGICVCERFRIEVGLLILEEKCLLLLLLLLTLEVEEDKDFGLP